MKSALSPLLTLFVFSALAFAQRPNWPSPPQAADQSSTAAPASPVKTPQARANFESQAREILDLAQSLQADIQQVNRGVLPKETVAKLKRLEKLSKNLRTELAP